MVIHYFFYLLQIPIWPLDGTQVLPLVDSGHGSNGNEVLYTPQSSRTGASPSDAVYCPTQSTTVK